MALPIISTIQVPDYVSLITVVSSTTLAVSSLGISTLEKTLYLPSINSFQNNRILYLKELTGQAYNLFEVYPASNTNNGIGGVSSLTVNTLGCAQLQANGTNWDILQFYDGSIGYADVAVSSPITSLFVSTNMSYFNVDLTLTSKQLFLEDPNTITTTSNSSLFYTFKDLYGVAATNPLYISATGSATIDNASNIMLSTNYASIELMGDPIHNKWAIVGYYSGS